MADLTPPTRNRTADLLRAASIGVVVFGHWLMAAPFVDAEGPHTDHVLSFAPWTHWLTWALQVMPVFFFVGGYSNAVSYEAALRKGRTYGEWLHGRVARLLAPVLPVVLLWAALGAIAHATGVPADMVRVASITALVPTWFLAVYLLVIPLVPLARAAWRRAGMLSIWGPAAAAAVMDLLYFQFDLHGPGWINYLFVWFAVHQLGFAWLNGRTTSAPCSVVRVIGGLALLVCLTELGPWPRSLVGVPGEEFSNTTPPHVPLLALTAIQFGLAMLLEPPLKRWLAGRTAWTATVLVNGMIMTIFLWHSTVMMLLFGLSIWQLDAFGLRHVPGSGAWWAAKSAWVLAFTLVLLPLLGPLARIERAFSGGGGTPHPARLIGGSLLACAGLAQLTLFGVGGDGWLGLRLVPLALPWIGAELAGLGVLSRLTRR